jgi:EpsI family protein
MYCSIYQIGFSMHHALKKALILMLAAFVAAIVLRPTHKVADTRNGVELNHMIPSKFGDWTEVKQDNAQIINPQQRATLAKIYSQTLSRTYVNTRGEAVMVSIAYGADQSDSNQLHYPEACYPAQGFQLGATELGVIKTDFGDIRVKRIFAVLGNRTEPLTYWATVGNKVVVGGKEMKLEQLRYGFKGYIPDGLLFRVSSISDHAEDGYNTQQLFVKALVANLKSDYRLRLTGLL